MKSLPPRPDIGHLKKQAKALLAAARQADPAALERFRAAFPAARGKGDAALAAQGLRLHDAQSCRAREHGFDGWTDLLHFVEARRAQADDPHAVRLRWLRLVYDGDLTGGNNARRPAVAARLLAEDPALAPDGDPWLACAIGDEALLRVATQRDAGWVHRPGGPLMLPPLVAVTHSGLLAVPGFADGLRACAALLLAAGASPDQSVGSRWSPTSLASPDVAQPLSALYGAAGKARDPELTALLLAAGAEPDDGESLYHALESPACTELLLRAGARVGGTYALYRSLDLDDPAALRLLLTHGADPNEAPSAPPAADWGSPLLWAIRRRRSTAHVAALLDAGAKADVCTPDGVPARTLALRFGLSDVAALLAPQTLDERSTAIEAALPEKTDRVEAFVAACARGDVDAARALQADDLRLADALDAAQQRLLPELAAAGCDAAVRAMVACGWPLEVRGGDIDGTALNQALFRGDAALVRFLLARGADWRTPHGFGDDARGTLSWASLNRPVQGGDWPACAQALLDHGLPPARPDPAGSDAVLIEGRPYRFEEEVAQVLSQAPARSAP
ncbi:ankyrin repeat domain-containing protein [Pseudacidovorax sp. RU35E]|uniref:ankyrin repeat domain-containing protein n=1 Tax=Pseudacidovorax sp. RU35E TaxID=1907403 RepID=UPI000955026D|nr:ankyrin repeat domain-containing protein [Pseudacidovorax sp. RU35E]SIQ56984.1 hypothetical protein SAMN05880557_104308 [Pseudacidovorax sp. RU35E]